MPKPVTFYSEGVKLVGDVYLPEDIKPGERRAGVVLCHGYTGVRNLYLPDNARVETIFTHMGYRPVFRYEKFRTEYTKRAGNGGKVLLDETPIGNFLEIEGSPRWIDRSARLLGFSSEDYITRSYGYLYLAYCREKRIPPKDMLFKPRRGGR